ncbi:SLATT domain-containing protein [Micromonospora sp. CPCC 205539]|uniref:SLATT domain-containing protein n=1 Tax=Micromonospora sp. CPCC 205539 TaxID=3122408 RepID=UPI002FEF9AEF
MDRDTAVAFGGEQGEGPTALTLLERLRLRAHRSSRAQYLAGKRANWWHNFLGIPVVVSTAIVGTSIFANISSKPQTAWVILAGALSLLAAVLASLQTFFKFSERAEKHRNAGAAYAALKREMDILKLGLETASIGPAEAYERLSQLTEGLNSLQRESLDVPDAVYDQARREQDLDAEGI